MRLWAAWAALAWERLWPRLWPAVAVFGATLALILLDVLSRLPPWLHATVLAAALAALIALIWTAIAGTAWPDRSNARRRLEQDSGFEHRPLTAMEDAQSAGVMDPGSRLLWNAHLLRLRAATTRWVVRPPRPGLASQDPYGLRGGLGLLLVIAVVVAGADWDARLGRNLVPAFAGSSPATPPSLDVSVSPPGYTGAPPVYLQPAPRDPGAPENAPPTAPPDAVEIPAGSTLLARVSGGSEPPVLSIGGERTAFEALGDDGFEVEETISAGSGLSISQDGTTLGVWSIRVIPDLAPEIAFTEPPRATERNALRLAYQAKDDYGIESISATLLLELDAESSLEREPLTLELPPPGTATTSADGVFFQDLTAHPWAGEPVRVRLAASDNAGNTGQSSQMLVRLPEREFLHPVAQAIVEQRRTLIRDVAAAESVAEGLYGLSAQVNRYDGDTVVFLALRTAARRLIFAQSRVSDAVDPVAQLLWDTALRIEDGDLSLMERELRAAQEDLRRALISEASDEEIAELTDRLEAALERYLDALARDMARHAPNEPGQPQSPPGSLLPSTDFTEMIDALRAMNESGARDQARQMLSELQDMLESLQTGRQAVEQNQAMEALNAMMDEMQSLMTAQQALFDDTHQSGSGAGTQTPDDAGEPGVPGMSGSPEPFGGSRLPRSLFDSTPGSTAPSQPGIGEPAEQQATAEELAELARRQDEIRRNLGEMMRQIGEMTGSIPEELGGAEQAMRQSGQSLTGGDAGGSLPPQEQALEGMRQGTQSFLNTVLDRMAQQGQGTAAIPGSGNGAGQDGRDPLGRPTDGSGTYADDDVDLPGRDATERARAILEELRRRAGDQSRPEIERDYVDRLLERF
ncbi:TIGR02302 family protein [Fodinicurvata sp. EGI_FJ10296]|uniref:TIGR02302 family protein n=1 Tax=Fodinicurvata sp. EGI_FJ10296 TaxID=3231908 RepID=UPI0034551E52